MEYSNNVKAGTATVTIKGTGIYSGTVSKNFEIKEALYTVYGYQVVINGNFDLKYYIDLSKEAANDTDAYIEFKVGDKVQKVKQRETSNGHYVYTCEVPVAQIGDKVTATLHYKDKSYALTQYSVKDYLNTIVQNKDKKEEYGKAADIASAILNYGARAQLYFGYKTDSLVYSALPDAEIKKVDSILAQDIKKAITNKESGNLENNDFKYYGASLVCKSDTGMKLYFENKNSLSLKEIEKKYDISVYLTEEQLNKRIAEIGAQITEKYRGQSVYLICILKGSIFFTTELGKRIDLPMTMDFMSVSSYGSGTESSGDVKIKKDLEHSIEGENVIIIEDIIDSGNTLSRLSKLLAKRNPKSLTICTLLDKPERRVVDDVNVDYVGFVIPDKFVVGYGLDYDQRFRNLPYIGFVEGEIK